jgi:hypothetical protein
MTTVGGAYYLSMMHKNVIDVLFAKLVVAYLSVSRNDDDVARYTCFL